MTASALERIPSHNGTPQRLGQATAVEQSRAVAQVEAQIVVAMRFPRSVPVAIEAMREACAQVKLAEKAFYRFPRGGQNVSGPSIHLARELARVWGNFEYGIAELRRDDEHGQSEMLAFAWDLQTNTRNSSVFINPHLRDKRGGPELLTDMRDIYESNANAGARRVREAIFASLPTWFVEEAKDLCARTLADGGGKPLAQRVADAIATFGHIGVTPAQLEEKIGSPSAKWIAQDVATLSVIYRSIQRGEVRKDEEFPAVGVSAQDILGGPQPEPGRAEPFHGGPKATQAQVGTMHKEFARLGFTDEERDQRLSATAKLAGLPGLETSSALTKSEASYVIDRLKNCETRGELVALLVNGDKPQDGTDG